MFFIGFNILSSYFIRPTYWIYQIIYKAKSIKFVFKLYTDHDTLWAKHGTHQKVEPLRTASPSNLGNMVNNSSNFNTKYVEFSTKCRCSLIFITHLVDTTNAAIFTKKQFLLFSQVQLPYLTLACSQIVPQFPLTVLSYITQQFFTPLFLRTPIPTI